MILSLPHLQGAGVGVDTGDCLGGIGCWDGSQASHCKRAEAFFFGVDRQVLGWVVIDESLFAVLEGQPRDEHAEFEGAADVGIKGESLSLGGGEEIARVADALADQQVLAEELDLVNADEEKVLDGYLEGELGAVPGLWAILADFGTRAELGAGAVLDEKFVCVPGTEAREADQLWVGKLLKNSNNYN